jgi:hypothetical protein
LTASDNRQQPVLGLLLAKINTCTVNY